MHVIRLGIDRVRNVCLTRVGVFGKENIICSFQANLNFFMFLAVISYLNLNLWLI